MLSIRCVTCGKPIAQFYNEYKEQVRKLKLSKGQRVDKIEYLSSDNIKKSAEGQVMDDLKIIRTCCRRTLLTHGKG